MVKTWSVNINSALNTGVRPSNKRLVDSDKPLVGDAVYRPRVRLQRRSAMMLTEAVTGVETLSPEIAQKELVLPLTQPI